MQMGKFRNGRERQPCVSVPLGAHVMEKQSSLAEARTVDDQLHVEHDLQSDSLLLHDVQNSGKQFPGAFLLEFQKCYCS